MDIPELQEKVFEWDWGDLDVDDLTQPVPAIEKVGARGLVEIKWDQNMRKPRSFEEIE